LRNVSQTVFLTEKGFISGGDDVFVKANNKKRGFHDNGHTIRERALGSKEIELIVCNGL
jgi:hypothetical protein